METNFNSNSQVCTSKIQSERLLALGLKKETADMTWFRRSKNVEWEISTDSYIDWVKEILPLELGYTHEDIIPAWSLHRLIEMIDDECIIHLKNFTASGVVCYKHESLFDNIIDCIERKIKKGYFNKEYLV